MPNVGSRELLGRPSRPQTERPSAQRDRFHQLLDRIVAAVHVTRRVDRFGLARGALDHAERSLRAARRALWEMRGEYDRDEPDSTARGERSSPADAEAELSRMLAHVSRTIAARREIAPIGTFFHIFTKGF